MALVGIDIGGSKLAVCVADDAGRIRGRWRAPHEPGADPERTLARLAAEAGRLAERAGLRGAPRAVGVSVPGPLDPARERLLRPPNLEGWEGLPLRARLSAAFGAPTSLENDANAAALAEWRFGAARGASDAVFLTMSTGVGAGLILGGRLQRGHAGQAGEVGHALAVEDGEPCACGLRGCFEAYLGGAAWARRLRARPLAGRALELAGAPERLAPEHVVAAAGEGDPAALEELGRYNALLARLLVQLVFTLAPEVVVLGTIPSRAGEALCLGPVRERVAARLWPSLAADLRILPSALGDALPDHAGLAVALEGPSRA